MVGVGSSFAGLARTRAPDNPAARIGEHHKMALNLTYCSQ